jgi:Cysteine rich repeat
VLASHGFESFQVEWHRGRDLIRHATAPRTARLPSSSRAAGEAHAAQLLFNRGNAPLPENSMNVTQTALRSLAVAALSLSALMPAFAAREGNGMMQACRADFGKFCKSVQPGGGRVVECLKQHEAELAPACKQTLGTVDACGPEVKKICGDQAGGQQGAVRECIKAHANEFSAACRAAIAPK